MHRIRKSGILLHPTSLPTPGGIGTMGRDAFAFVDFLQEAGQTVWQVLPLGPTGYGNSPYSCYSAFAGNPLLVDLQALVAEGDLTIDDLAAQPQDERKVDFDAVAAAKDPLLRAAAARFFAAADSRREDFWRFCDSTPWLHDYALFMAVKESHRGLSWSEWPQPISRRQPAAVEEYSISLGKAIGEHKYMQWQFFRQWKGLKSYANARDVEIFGDIPIFVAYDSADVWANPYLFLLDANEKPSVVAGVPPDYFSATGQLWGNPLYDWNEMASRGYSWWIDRVRTSLELYDLIRIDHFRGFAAYWEVKATEKTAVNGRWVPGPADSFFRALATALGPLPIVAEDLGLITPDVEELRERFALPGMKVLQFAFGSGSRNPYLPHNHIPNAVVYTGTHDNDTTVGWYATLPDKTKKHLHTYLGTDGSDIAWDLIRSCLSSVCARAVVPLQDILSLGSEAKMNQPGAANGNWAWRLQPGELLPAHAHRLRQLTRLFGRLPEKEA